MARQVTNDFLTADELNAFDKDLDYIVDDAQTKTAITYTHTGAASVARYTGVVTLTGGTNQSINAVRLEPKQEEMDKMNIQEASDKWLIRAADLSSAPVIDDTITVSSDKKSVIAHKTPIPGKFYVVWTKDIGN